MSKYWKFIAQSDCIPEEVPGRNHHWYFNEEISEHAGIYMVRAVFPKGGRHDFHRHPKMSEIIYVLKGTAEQWVEDEKQILKPNDSVYIHQNVVHATFNIGDEPLEILAILSPSDGWEAGTVDEFENTPYSKYRNDS